MVLTRIQASDFQNAGIKGNLSKLEAIAKSANDSKPAGVDLVGDIFDAHAMEEIQNQFNSHEEESKLRDDPKLKDLITEDNNFMAVLGKKYGSSVREKIQKNQLEPSELKALEDLKKREKEAGLGQALTQAQGSDSYGAIQNYYGLCAQRIGGIKSPVYAVRGNNDLNCMQDIVKARYPELERKLLEDGPFRIIGMNNTNLSGDIIKEYGELAVPSDSKEAYDIYNLKKTGGKKANVIMMHDPPTTKGAEGIVKLIQEHVQPGKFLLVECGHVHKAMIQTVADKSGKGGYVVARSSPNIFFEHSFDEKGDYQYTDIYKYKPN